MMRTLSRSSSRSSRSSHSARDNTRSSTSSERSNPTGENILTREMRGLGAFFSQRPSHSTAARQHRDQAARQESIVREMDEWIEGVQRQLQTTEATVKALKRRLRLSCEQGATEQQRNQAQLAIEACEIQTKELQAKVRALAIYIGCTCCSLLSLPTLASNACRPLLPSPLPSPNFSSNIPIQQCIPLPSTPLHVPADYRRSEESGGGAGHCSAREINCEQV